MTIRARLTIGVTSLLLVGFGVLGAAVVTTTRAALVEQVDARNPRRLRPSGSARLAARSRRRPWPQPRRGTGRAS